MAAPMWVDSGHKQLLEDTSGVEFRDRMSRTLILAAAKAPQRTMARP